MANEHDVKPEVFGAGASSQKRSVRDAMWRGARKQCPQCGTKGLFAGYTKVNDKCGTCGLDFSHHRADDAPPYFTIIIVGHILVPLGLAYKEIFDPPMWAQFIVWIPLLLVSTIWFLPVCKGALIGLQWANRMHGFGSKAKEYT